MAAVIKAKPGTWRGQTYRSQLEIKWAKHLEKLRRNSDDKWQIRYVDESAYDFEIAPRPKCLSRLFVEVKPLVYDVCIQAIMRLDFGKFKPGDRWVLVAGAPHSSYGIPRCMQFNFVNVDGRCAPFPIRSAVITAGEMEQCNELYLDCLSPVHEYFLRECVFSELEHYEAVEAYEECGDSMEISAFVLEMFPFDDPEACKKEGLC